MRIHVATHKQAWLPQQAVYCGVALGGRRIEGCEMQDDVGEDNISHLNRSFCELTATYAIWKNSRESTVGLCHYRRYFNLIPNNLSHLACPQVALDDNVKAIIDNAAQQELVEQALGHYDIIVPRGLHGGHPVGVAYKNAHSAKEWDDFIEALDLLYGSRQHGLSFEPRIYPWNMLICRKTVFDLYSQQLFFVLQRVFAKNGVPAEKPGERYQPYRYPGFLGERFMSAFLNANRLRFYEAQVLILKDV